MTRWLVILGLLAATMVLGYLVTQLYGLASLDSTGQILSEPGGDSVGVLPPIWPLVNAPTEWPPPKYIGDATFLDWVQRLPGMP